MRALTIRLYFLLLIVIVNSGVISVGLVQIADELLLLLSIGIIWLGAMRPKLSKLNLISLRKFRRVTLIYAFYVFLISIASPFSLNPLLSTAQAFINIKFVLISLAGLLVSSDPSAVRYVRVLFKVTVVLFSIGLGFNLVIGESWNLFFAPNDEVLYRFNLIRPVGWFGHPSQNGYFLGLFGATVVLLWSLSRKTTRLNLTRAFWVFFLLNISVTVLINVRKALFALIFFAVAATERLGNFRRSLLLVFLALSAAVGGYFAKDTAFVAETLNDISNMMHNDNDDYIRGLMVFNGLRLFLEFFPFGVGGGTFGTVLSQFNTMSVYEYVGLNMAVIYTDGGKLDGVYDSGMFSMMAENGFVGMILLLLVVVQFYKSAGAMMPFAAFPILKILTGYAVLLSFTEPAWQNGLFSAFFAINIAYVASCMRVIDSRRCVKVEALT